MFTDEAQTALGSRRLWFGCIAAAVAWMTLGALDLVITWRACMHQEAFGIPTSPLDLRVLFVVVALLLFLIAVAAGVTSYRNWSAYTTERSLLESVAVDRREFMALIGVIVSITLGVGIIWLAIPPFLLDLCWRAR